MTRVGGDVARHSATVERLTGAGKQTREAQASLGFEENSLALLQGHQRFLRLGEPAKE